MKKQFIIILLLNFSLVFSQNKTFKKEIDSLKSSGNKFNTLTLNYGYIACSCAQWAESKYNGKKSDKRVQMYLEPANDSLAKIISVEDVPFPLKVKVTGYYKTKSGFPRNYKQLKGKLEPAPVFRFYEVKVITKNQNGS